jgi:4-hydroxy-2-oxoheptanedioate aldolase
MILLPMRTDIQTPTRTRQRLVSGELVFGTFLKTTDPAFAEIAAIAGLDFAILDTEHGVAGTAMLHNLVRAVQAGGALPVVRVAANRPELIQAALDSGADGVQVPGVTSAAEARAVARAAYFAPKGQRGVCRYVRAARYSATPAKDYFAGSQNVLTIVHIEGKEALEAAAAIAAVEGIDICFIGPWDLSQSLGIPGEVGHPKMLTAIHEIASQLRAAGKILGTFLDDTQHLAAFAAAGIQYFAYSTDVGLFYNTCATLADNLRQTANHRQ